MSIVVVCKNGHRLRAPDKKAGTVGRCPACGAEVEIPKLGTMPTDSSIMRILGVNDELRRKMDEYDAEHANQATAEQNVPPPDPDLPPPQARKKVCPQCDWEIDAGYRICPHCRYYFMK